MESSSCRLDQVRQHKTPGLMPFGCKYNKADVLGPEEEPPDAKHRGRFEEPRRDGEVFGDKDGQEQEESEEVKGQ